MTSSLRTARVWAKVTAKDADKVEARTLAGKGEWLDDDLYEDGEALPHAGQDRDQNGPDWSDLLDPLEAIEDPAEMMDAALSLVESVDDFDGELAEELDEFGIDPDLARDLMSSAENGGKPGIDP